MKYSDKAKMASNIFLVVSMIVMLTVVILMGWLFFDGATAKEVIIMIVVWLVAIGLICLFNYFVNCYCRTQLSNVINDMCRESTEIWYKQQG